jgi:hypothetical protein
MPILSSFLSGAVFMACIAIALQFRRLWRQTSDRLFAYFFAAFLALAAERVVLAIVSSQNELAPFVYLVRLTAFILIIAGVIDKNRSR